MPDSPPFAEFIARIRAGDARAAEELVQKYEPIVRRAVRVRLQDRRLQRLFDSMDICQSVLQSFFVRTAAGQYDLEEPGQLIGLLISMAGTKLAFEARKQHRQRRDQRRVTEGNSALGGVAADDPSPSRAAADRDLLAAARERFTEEERILADLRANGLTWEEIAEKIGGTAQARRVQFSRALDRVASELGIDSVDAP